MNMKNIMRAIFLLCFVSNAVCAQKNESPYKNSFSLGAELSLPVGLLGEIYSGGIGVSGQGKFMIANNFALTLYAGYINYFLKSTYGSGNQGYIPLLNGVEFNISPYLFGSAQFGYTFYTKGGGGAFTYSPGIGYKISKNLSALIKYVGQIKSAINSSSIGLRTAYTFGK
jgi:hypothetical protein